MNILCRLGKHKYGEWTKPKNKKGEEPYPPSCHIYKMYFYVEVYYKPADPNYYRICKRCGKVQKAGDLK